MYLIGLVEPWTCYGLSDTGNEPTPFVCNLRFPMLDLE